MYAYVFSTRYWTLTPVGFPIRKSPGQSLFSGSPKLIAAYHVLHRLSLPRHPPYALSSLTIKKLLIDRTYYRTIIPKQAVTPMSQLFTYKSLYAIVKERIRHERSKRVQPKMVEVNGIEPMTPACKAGALPAELHPHFKMGN